MTKYLMYILIQLPQGYRQQGDTGGEVQAAELGEAEARACRQDIRYLLREAQRWSQKPKR
jgi:hypothetical protein